MIGVLLEVPGGKQEQYEAAMKELDLDGTPPQGAIFHSAGPMEGGWRVYDVWESREDFDAFVQSKLMAALQKAGVPPAQPKFFEVVSILR